MSTDVKTPSYAEGLKELRNNLSSMLPSDALDVFDQDAQALQKHYPDILKINVGDIAPDFTLLNATGESVKLSDLLKRSKVVLTFYRGTWCPYCNLQLHQYQQILGEIKSAGAELVAISPQTPDESLNIKEKNELQFEVLSDNGNIVTRRYTTVFKYGDVPVGMMTKLGFDFDAYYSDNSREIPVPAVFIIEQDRTVTFAKSMGGDYRNRVEGTVILNALRN